MGKSKSDWLSGIAYSIHPKLGKVYDSNRVFWNDGIVGFVIGVPLTWVLYQPFLPFIPALLQLPFYIGCAFVSFCVQHLFRRKWVFKPQDIAKQIEYLDPY